MHWLVLVVFAEATVTVSGSSRSNEDARRTAVHPVSLYNGKNLHLPSYFTINIMIMFPPISWSLARGSFEIGRQTSLHWFKKKIDDVSLVAEEQGAQT